MEPYAAKTILVSLVSDCKMKIATFTTDRSSSIRSMMQDPLLSHIHHEFDPWHWISKFNTIPKYGFGIVLKPSLSFILFFLELVMKDVWKAAKNSSCAKLNLWRDSISNMLWWSFATSSKPFFLLLT